MAAISDLRAERDSATRQCFLLQGRLNDEVAERMAFAKLANFYRVRAEILQAKLDSIAKIVTLEIPSVEMVQQVEDALKVD